MKLEYDKGGPRSVAAALTGTALDELADDVRITPEKDPAESVGVSSVLELTDSAEKQGEAYDAALSRDDESLAGLEVPMMKTCKIEELHRDEIANLMIPQFVETSDAGLFGAEKVLLASERLLDGFKLSAQDATVDFNPMLSGAVQLDLGKAWANAAGPNYKYFMVFKDEGVGVTGAVKIDELLNTIEKL